MHPMYNNKMADLSYSSSSPPDRARSAERLLTESSHTPYAKHKMYTLYIHLNWLHRELIEISEGESTFLAEPLQL